MKLTVPAGETTVLPYYVLAPDQEGNFRCEFNTGFVDGNQFTLLHQFMYDFEVQKDRTRRLEEAIGAIGELNVSGNERSMRKNAQQFLQNVLNLTATTCEQTELNIHDIEKFWGREILNSGDTILIY